MPPDVFVAIDFETATQTRDSACAVALVRVEGRRIVHEEARLIRPPSRAFVFTYLHGIAWEHVSREPAFPDVWAALAPVVAGARCFVAHNAPFDRSVLAACCARYRLPVPTLPFECTVRLARRAWDHLPNHQLPTVCDHLGIPLDHHDALSDARACARILLAAEAASRARTAG